MKNKRCSTEDISHIVVVFLHFYIKSANVMYIISTKAKHAGEKDIEQHMYYFIKIVIHAWMDGFCMS